MASVPFKSPSDVTGMTADSVVHRESIVLKFECMTLMPSTSQAGNVRDLYTMEVPSRVQCCQRQNAFLKKKKFWFRVFASLM